MNRCTCLLALGLALSGPAMAADPVAFLPGDGGNPLRIDRAVLWCDPPDFDADAGSSEVIGDHDLWSEIANDLILEMDATIRKVTWWGQYWGGYDGIPTGSGFNLRFYYDDGCLPQVDPFLEILLPGNDCGETHAEGKLVGWSGPGATILFLNWEGILERLTLSHEEWAVLGSHEAGITFKYPVGQQMLEDTHYSFREWPDRTWDPTGTLYEWNGFRADKGWHYAFAGGVSDDAKMGRQLWVTDKVRWNEENAGEALLVITRDDGLQGAVFEPYMFMHPDEVDLVATLNFPDGYHEKLKGVTFYFYEETSLDIIEQVIKSVTFLWR